jgi:tRNA (cmo5U34)-methyltransferase
MSSSLNQQPTGRWAFDDAVTACFEDMLERSIPQYPVMRETVAELAVRFVQPNSTVVDLGTSQGEMIARLVPKLPECRFVGVEISEPMRQAAIARFQGQSVDILPLDLRTAYPDVQASVTLAVLTLQFTPLEYRPHIVRRVFEHTQPGGAFILVEKVLGNHARIDEAMVKHYLSLKANNGYSQEAIQRKRLSLEGVLVPLSARWNEELLRNAGFEQVDCFWRWMNFAGWVALKA